MTVANVTVSPQRVRMTVSDLDWILTQSISFFNVFHKIRLHTAPSLSWSRAMTIKNDILQVQ